MEIVLADEEKSDIINPRCMTVTKSVIIYRQTSEIL